MICSYCGTENKANICEFCGADLTATRPTLRDFVTIRDSKLPMPELATFHTYDLLVLLRLIREERSSFYKLLHTVRQDPKGEYFEQEDVSYIEEQYRLYTARMRVVEGILIDRLGYKPKRVDDKLLMALKQKIEAFKNTKIE